MIEGTIELKKIRKADEILGVTYRFIGQNFKILSLSLLLIAGPVILIMGILTVYLRTLVYNSEFIFLLGLFSYLRIIVSLLVVLLVTISVFQLYMDKEKISFEIKDVWEAVKKNTVVMSGSYIRFFLATIGYAFLFVIPAIIYSVTQSTRFIAQINENITGKILADRCVELSKGHWWNMFGVQILLFVNVLILSLVTTLPLTVLTVLKLYHSNGDIGDGQALLNNPIFIAAEIFASFNNLFYCVLFIGNIFVYFSLVEKKEAKSLFEKLDQLPD